MAQIHSIKLSLNVFQEYFEIATIDLAFFLSSAQFFFGRLPFEK